MRLKRSTGSPIAPLVLLLLSMPKAMLGKTQAKYRNIVAAATLCGVLRPITPVKQKPGETVNRVGTTQVTPT